jgi:hypothetical protein
MTRRRARSWVDVVIGWIDRLPGPAWAAYAALIVLGLVLTIVPRLLVGDPIEPLAIVFGGLTFTPFAVAHAINLASERALADFRPALGALEVEYDDLERRLTSASVATGILGAGLGLVIVTIGNLTVDGAWGVGPENSLATNVVTYLSQVILNAALLTFLLQLLGHVRTIARIHRESTNIELWNVRPHNAFARVTVLAAIVITVLYASAAAASAASTDNSLIAIGFVILALVIATLVFVGPLVGMRRRLLREKERQIGETDRVFEVAAVKLRADVDAGDLDSAARLESVVSALVAERERLRKVSAWPWSADTLRAFVTTLVVPVFLWFLTSLLSRLLFA